MQAVILAAGLGTRMRPLTNDTPKPLLKVLGRPLLEYNLEALKEFVDEIIIVVGYKSEMIKSYFGHSFKGKPIRYVEQKEQLGTGHALLCAEPMIKDRFIIILGDDFAAAEVIRKAVMHRLCVVARKVGDPERFGIVETSNGYVTGLEEKPARPKSDLANTGIWVMDRKIIELMKRQGKSKRGEYELPDALLELIKTEKVSCEAITEGWIPIGYPDDLKKLEIYLRGDASGRTQT
jgi:bifunctional UDP-N-acetylglucosamine pyrophosphorylase/glucosamine-1-phosphate N-acetyltransferase